MCVHILMHAHKRFQMKNNFTPIYAYINIPVLNNIKYLINKSLKNIFRRDRTSNWMAQNWKNKIACEYMFARKNVCVYAHVHVYAHMYMCICVFTPGNTNLQAKPCPPSCAISYCLYVYGMCTSTMCRTCLVPVTHTITEIERGINIFDGFLVVNWY